MTVLASIFGDGWGFHHGDMGIGWWIVMMLGMVIFWGAVIALVVWMLRGATVAPPSAPHEILRRRLADGSISVEEYERSRAVLDAPTSASSARSHDEHSD
jgi:putative membrane protein